MSHCSEVNIDIYGKSAHIAKAAEGIDATQAAANILLRAYEMERAYPKEVYRLLKFGSLHSGTARNALSPTAVWKAHFVPSVRRCSTKYAEN